MATVFFPPVEPIWDFYRDAVRFYAIVERNTITCLILAEALMQRFGANSLDAAECIRAYSANMGTIHEKARQKIEQADDRLIEVVLHTSDFIDSPTSIEFPRSEYMQVEVAPEVRADESCLKAALKVTQAFHRYTSRSKIRISVSWDVLTSPDGPILYLVITDDETEVKSEGLFTSLDPFDVSSVAFDVWDNLLANSSAKLRRQQATRVQQGDT